MVAIQEGSLVRLGRLIGLDGSPQQPAVERERLTLEELINLGAFPVAEGFNFLFRENREKLTDDELTPDILIEYFNAISLACENPGRSIALGKPDVLWSADSGNSLVVDATKLGEDGSERTMALPLVQLSGNPDRNRPPLTKNQLTDALYYLWHVPNSRGPRVLTSEEAAGYVKGYGDAYRHYIAAFELLNVKGRKEVSIVNPKRNRPLSDFTFIPLFQPEDEDSVRESVRVVIGLADKRKALTSKLTIKEHDGITAATIGIRELGENIDVIEDHYRNPNHSDRPRMITNHDRAKALKYFLTAGVLTEAEVSQLELRLRAESYRISHPIETDPLSNLRTMIRHSPLLGKKQPYRIEGKTYTQKHEHPIGTYAVSIGITLMDLPIGLTIFTGKSDVTPRYMFIVPLRVTHDDIRARVQLANAYLRYASTPLKANSTLKNLSSDGHEIGIPQMYRDDEDKLVLVWGFDGSKISYRLKQRDIAEGNIFPPVLEEGIIQEFRRTLEGVYAMFYAGGTRRDRFSVTLKNRIPLVASPTYTR